MDKKIKREDPKILEVAMLKLSSDERMKLHYMANSIMKAEDFDNPKAENHPFVDAIGPETPLESPTLPRGRPRVDQFLEPFGQLDALEKDPVPGPSGYIGQKLKAKGRGRGFSTSPAKILKEEKPLPSAPPVEIINQSKREDLTELGFLLDGLLKTNLEPIEDLQHGPEGGYHFVSFKVNVTRFNEMLSDLSKEEMTDSSLDVTY